MATIDDKMSLPRKIYTDCTAYAGTPVGATSAFGGFGSAKDADLSCLTPLIHALARMLDQSLSAPGGNEDVG